MIRILVWLSRYLLALTFILSGFVKGVDPLGSAYKFGDYFSAFGLSFMEPIAVPLAFILCAAELFIGLLLLFKVRNVFASWGAFVFMIIFTPLTFVLAIFNPVSDCGCFGDAIILTNWETFFKNIPLLGASILLLVYRKKLEKPFTLVNDIVLASFLLIASFFPSFYGYYNLPLMDFRPYSIGTNIQEAMAFPADAPTDEYKTLLYYEKDGVVKEFTQDNFPWQDTTWKYVDSKSILLKKGYTPSISNFVLTDFEGWEYTDSILNYKGYYILAVSYRLSASNTHSFAKLNELYFKAKELGIGFACITASPPSDIDQFISNTGVAFPFLLADEIMLKTTIRANPGIILLHNGTIIGKWHYSNLPESTFFEGNLTAKAMQNQQENRRILWIYIIVLTLVGFKLALLPLVNKCKISKSESLG
jgi:uncharacterized membrane protein YphA (DoxX/SURF4 family)